ncbi:MAG: DUF1175 family protein [Myxococcales bacterium]
MAGALLAALLLASAEPSEALLRQMIGEVALAQLERISNDWHPDQRDCAGLVRFAYRAAFLALRPERLAEGLWRDREGKAASFADAETLVAHSFALLGRGEEARKQLQTGDLVAFRQLGDGDAPVFHLMIVVQPRDRAHARTRVVYHPGSRGAEVRLGALDELARDAPAEWRPVPENPRFLGFYRFKEWR